MPEKPPSISVGGGQGWHKVEVLEPETLRRQVAGELARAAASYAPSPGAAASPDVDRWRLLRPGFSS